MLANGRGNPIYVIFRSQNKNDQLTLFLRFGFSCEIFRNLVDNLIFNLLKEIILVHKINFAIDKSLFLSVSLSFSLSGQEVEYLVTGTHPYPPGPGK